MAFLDLERIDRSDCVVLLGLTALGIALAYSAWSWANVPIIDDWVYVWSVDHLIETGKLRVLEWSAHYPIVQVLWGALFSLVFGFSFGILRVSTLVVAWLGLLAFYLTLREMEIRPLAAAVGILVLLCNPVLFMLSNSFMTDVPFVSIMNGALLFYVRWTKRGKTRDLLFGSALTTAGFLIRQLGAALAIIPIGYLLLTHYLGPRRGRLPVLQHVSLLVPFVGFGVTEWWIHAVHGETRIYHEKLELLQFVWSTSGWIYLRELLQVVLQLGLVLWPLAMAIVNRLQGRALAYATGIVALLCGLSIFHWGELPNPLQAILSLNELGIGRKLIAGTIPDRSLIAWHGVLAFGISVSGAVVIVAALVNGARQWNRWVQGPATILLFNALCQLLLLEVLWLFYDRYYLPLLPGACVLLACHLVPVKRAIVVVLVGALSWGAVAVTGTIDMFRFLVAVASARNWLLQHGVGSDDIDAGYALNGWYLYAPSPSLSAGGEEPDVPFITSNRQSPYKIANAPEPDYRIVQQLNWPLLWAVTNTVYILKHSVKDR